MTAPTALGATLQRVVAVAREAGANRIADRLDVEVRTPRPAGTLVVAIGGAAAGTSAVVAALLDRPGWLDGDAATPSRAYLVVRYGQAGATAHRDDGSEPVVLAVDEVAAAVRGQHRDVGPHVRAVEVTLPSPLLADGTTIVDVPGVGGALASRDRDTAGLLDRADAVLYVASAASPLSRGEVDLLAHVSERVATVVVALGRTDQFTGWRTVRDDSQALLRAAVPALADAPVVPVSAALAVAADRLRGDGTSAELADDLEVESGVPMLLGVLQADVLDRGRALRAANLVRLCDHALAESRRVFDQRLAAPDDVAVAESEARARLESLRAVAGRAGAVTSEHMARLRDQVQRELTAGLRAAADGAERGLATARGPSGDEVLARLVADLRATDRSVERTVGTAVTALVAEVAQLLGEPIDVTELAPVASRLGEVDPTRLDVPEADTSGHSMGLTMTSMLVSSSTSVGILGQRLATGGVDALALLVGTGVALGAVRFVSSVRSSRRQRDVRDARARVRAALEQVRADEPRALRERIATLQREVEDAVRAAVQGRNEELTRQYDAVTALASASRAERDRALTMARDRLAELDRLAGALQPLREGLVT